MHDTGSDHAHAHGPGCGRVAGARVGLTAHVPDGHPDAHRDEH